MNQRRSPQRPSTCIFCDAKATSREHVFGEWAGKALGIDKTQVNEHYGRSFDLRKLDSPNSYSERVYRRTGSPISRREKIVCLRCNNGWMSRLEMSVQPFMTPMLTGSTTTLSTEEQVILATWAEKTSMIWEFADGKPPVSWSSQRTKFGRSVVALPTTRVWLGNYRGGHEPLTKVVDIHGYDTQGLAITRAVAMEQRPNYRFTVIGLGKVLLYVVFVTNSQVSKHLRYPGALPTLNSKLHQVWPDPRAALRWPNTEGFVEETLMALVDQ